MRVIFGLVLVSVVLGSVSAFRFAPVSIPRMPRIVAMQAEAGSEIGEIIAEASSPASPAAPSLFVGNLPFALTDDAFAELVRQRVGNVVSNVSLVRYKETGKSRGFGYMTLTEGVSADEVLQQLVGLEVEGRTIKIELKEDRVRVPFTVGTSGAAASTEVAESDSCTVFFGNLPTDITKEEFQHFIEKSVDTSTVSSIRLSMDRLTGRCKGFAHVIFRTPEHAENVIASMAGVQHSGRVLRVSKAARREVNADGRPRTAENAVSGLTVYVSNLAYGVDEKLIRDCLDDVIGKDSYTRVNLAKDKNTGKSRGFAYVDFVNQELVEKAITSLSNLLVAGRPLRAQRFVPSSERPRRPSPEGQQHHMQY